MNRNEAIKLLDEYIKNPNMIKHSLASESVMAKLADKLGYDRDKWAMAGLLHDLDVEITNADLKIHGKETARILREYNLDPDIIDAITRHNEGSTELKRETHFHFALASGETITGLITATTLVYPDKKLSSVKPKSVVKRMKEKAFAASVNRDIIMECEKLGMSIEEFAQLSLNAMQSINLELGL
ncbi:MAG TPA: hydrolase [Lentisphaeria bacterium]|nr:MAG: hydrolase [Lentisphaerae bacterium GWF2_38_69]HBM14874.1 hydrolase [Lentisphaeria bacterium]